MDFTKLNSLPQIRGAGWFLHVAEQSTQNNVLSFFTGGIPQALLQMFSEPRLMSSVYAILSSDSLIKGDDPAIEAHVFCQRYGYEKSTSVKLFMDAFVCLTIYRRQLERGDDVDVAGNKAYIFLQAILGEAKGMYRGNKLRMSETTATAIAEVLDEVYKGSKIPVKTN